MKKKSFLLSVAIILGGITPSVAQTKTIAIADVQTRKAVPYATVLSVEKKEGIYANENGIFERHKFNKVKITAIGYKDTVFNTHNIKDTMYLTPVIYNLSGVTITSTNTKEYLLGYFNEKKYTTHHCSSGIEIATYIANINNDENYIIKKIIFAAANPYEYQPSVFRIKIYNATTNKEIGNLLNNKDLIYNSLITSKRTVIDISSLNIRLPKEGIFISVEWLGIQNQKDNITYSYSKEPIAPLIYTTERIKNPIVYTRQNLGLEWNLFNTEETLKVLKSPQTFCISISN